MMFLYIKALLFSVFFLIFTSGSFAFAKEAHVLKEGIVLAAFGTSIPEAKVSFTSLEKDFSASFVNTPIYWTYTSQIIRKKLEKSGQHIPSIAEALESLAKDGVRIARIQPLHVVAGKEFAALERAVLLDIQKHPKRFDAVYIGRPLMESRTDALIVGKALLKHTQDLRKDGTALVLMGHGEEKGRAGLIFEGIRQVFSELDPLVFVATVEGERGFSDLLADLHAHNVKKVLLQPLMVVAGDHARNDLAGDEADSWKQKLLAQGFSVTVLLDGLGVLPEVGELYISHAKNSQDDLTKEPKKP